MKKNIHIPICGYGLSEGGAMKKMAFKYHFNTFLLCHGIHYSIKLERMIIAREFMLSHNARSMSKDSSLVNIESFLFFSYILM